MDDPNRKIQLVIFGLIGIFLVYDYSNVLLRNNQQDEAAVGSEPSASEDVGHQDDSYHYYNSEPEASGSTKFQIYQNDGGKEVAVETKISSQDSSRHRGHGSDHYSRTHQMRVLYCVS